MLRSTALDCILRPAGPPYFYNQYFRLKPAIVVFHISSHLIAKSLYVAPEFTQPLYIRSPWLWRRLRRTQQQQVTHSMSMTFANELMAVHYAGFSQFANLQVQNRQTEDLQPFLFSNGLLEKMRQMVASTQMRMLSRFARLSYESHTMYLHVCDSLYIISLR